MPSSAKPANSILRSLPSVDELLRSEAAREIVEVAGEPHTAGLCRLVIEKLRAEIAKPSKAQHSRESLKTLAETRLTSEWNSEQKSGLHRVINATGVVIHTNLGRAPLSEDARKAIAEASGYCTLEYDIETGKRGRRGRRAETLLAELTGAEDVLIVNNCAAAAFFVLTVFAAGGEVVISRGELVEIGGDFRVPDVLKQSRAKLREVGTTNRTKLADYENAITAKSKLILRVHPSNYRIVGFTASPTLDELADLAHAKELLLYEDLGSGVLVDIGKFGIADEPTVMESIKAGADIVTFSGDKLLGGPQAGIIAGKTEFVGRLRKNPLYRALRVDKLTYAALEATLEAYRQGQTDEIPVLKMLSTTKADITRRAEQFARQLTDKIGANSGLKVEMTDGVSAVGGGAAPASQLETKLLAFSHEKKKAPRLEQMLRNSEPPVIARIVEDKVMIDLRTVSEADETELLNAICQIA